MTEEEMKEIEARHQKAARLTLENSKQPALVAICLGSQAHNDRAVLLSHIREREAVTREEIVECIRSHYDARPANAPDDWEDNAEETTDAILALLKKSAPVDDWNHNMDEAPRDGTVFRAGKWVDGEMFTPFDCFFGIQSHTCGEMGDHCDSDWHFNNEGQQDPCFRGTIFEEPVNPTVWRIETPPTPPTGKES